MSSAAQSVRFSSAATEIPVIACPVCRHAMRLATIEPSIGMIDEKMTFRCDCGFEYHQSNAAAHERGR